MARLVKRAAPDIPKPLPPRGEAEEPETFLEKGPENQASQKSEPLMGWCLRCTHAANSRSDQLCYSCHKLEAGFVFDDETKTWVKPKEKK